MHINKVKAKCKKLGITFEIDEDSQCYRACAPAGYTIDGDLHEMIAVFGGGFIGNGGTKTAALEDLYKRLEQPTPCDNPKCEYCHERNEEMAMEWSHTAEAYAAVKYRIFALDLELVAVVYAEWMACDREKKGEQWNEAYDKALRSDVNPAVKCSVIADKAEALRTCTSDGHDAWICPYGCHTVSMGEEE